LLAKTNSHKLPSVLKLLLIVVLEAHVKEVTHWVYINSPKKPVSLKKPAKITSLWTLKVSIVLPFNNA